MYVVYKCCFYRILELLFLSKAFSWTQNILADLYFQQLMQELETERERRWKSEQAAKKLVEHIKELQSKGKKWTYLA